MAPASRDAQIVLEPRVQGSVRRVITIFETRDHFLACGSVRSVGDLLTMSGEELLLLELHLFPWGVADDASEATLPSGVRVVVRACVVLGAEDVGELQVPVEELIPC